MKSYFAAQPDIKVAVVVTKTCFHLMPLTRYHNCLFKIIYISNRTGNRYGYIVHFYHDK